jgi:hypothetical protein
VTKTKPRTLSQIRWLEKRRQMREEFLKGKACETCGGSDKLLVTWRQTPGPMEASKLWQVRAELRAQYLPLVMIRCTMCKNRKVGDQRRNGHGGGSQGITKCKCDECKAARSRYNTEWQKRKRRRLEALKALSAGKDK